MRDAYKHMTRKDARALLMHDFKESFKAFLPEAVYNSAVLASVKVFSGGSSDVDVIATLVTGTVALVGFAKSYERNLSGLLREYISYRRDVSDYLRTHHGLDIVEDYP